MLHYIWLLCKRAALLLPGLFLAYLATLAVLPSLNWRINLGLSVLIAYVIGAYFVLPAVLRLFHMHTPTEHVPLYSITPDGFASDPVNVGIVGSRRQLIAAMEAIGWHRAQHISVRSAAHTIWAVLFHRSYGTMPISNLYLFGRPQDIGFEREVIKEGRGHRHHVRFWATTLKSIEQGTIFSGRKPSRAEQQIAERTLWAGAASKDIGVIFAAGTLKITHAVSPNTNHERALLVERLEAHGKAALVATVQLDEPYSLPNFAWSRALNTDGKMAVLRLK